MKLNHSNCITACMCLVIHQEFPMNSEADAVKGADEKQLMLECRQEFYERHQHHDLTAKTKPHYMWKQCVISIFMNMCCSSP